MKEEEVEVLTLDACGMPNGFACLSAAVLGALREHRQVFVYVGEDGSINYALPPEIARVSEPSLIAPLSSVIMPEDPNSKEVRIPLASAVLVKKVFAEAATSFDPGFEEEVPES